MLSLTYDSDGKGAGVGQLEGVRGSVGHHCAAYGELGARLLAEAHRRCALVVGDVRRSEGHHSCRGTSIGRGVDIRRATLNHWWRSV